MTSASETLVNELEAAGASLDAEQKKVIETALDDLLEGAHNRGYGMGFEEGYSEGFSEGQDDAELSPVGDDDLRRMFEAFKIGNDAEAMRIARQIAESATGGILT